MMIGDLERSVNTWKLKTQDLIRKHKTVEDREAKLSQSLKPKLQQAIDHQKYLHDNFKQIKEDTELLPMIFRAEATVRKRALAA